MPLTAGENRALDALARRAKRMNVKDTIGPRIRQARKEADEYVPVSLRALDELALALTEHRHKWSNELRRLYERATASLRRRPA